MVPAGKSLLRSDMQDSSGILHREHTQKTYQGHIHCSGTRHDEKAVSTDVQPP